MSITTKGGDGGETSLYSGERVKKSDLIMETIGTIDELNSWVGLIKCKIREDELKSEVEKIQRNLFNLCSTIATKESSDFYSSLIKVDEESLKELEDFEDFLLTIVKMPERFIIPGVNENSAFADIARTVCRRAERRFVKLCEVEKENKESTKDYFFELKYVNRLSDVLFIIARYFDKGDFKEKWV